MRLLAETDMSYEYKTKPFEHQREGFEFSKDLRAYGILWEQGTGKTKLVIDNAAYLYEKREIDCVIVVAPSGVHSNWVTDEIPVHMPDRVMQNTKMFVYKTDSASTKRHQQDAEEILLHPGLIVVAMSYDSVVTEPSTALNKITGRREVIWKGGREYLWSIVKNRKCLYVADEGRRIKNPQADRTKVVVKSAKYASYRRLLNGTPVPNGAFDLYSQMLFLDENFWKPHSIGTWTAFKSMFGEFIPAQVRGPGGVLRAFQQLIGFKNLDLMQTILKSMCSRVVKEDVLDLPPKLYSTRTFDMAPAQKKVYDDLVNESLAWLDTGELVAAPMALTKLLRLQQVTSGFVPCEGGTEPIVNLGKHNPRLELLREICEDIPHKMIIWARFNRTVDSIIEMLGADAVRYDGQVSEGDRALAKNAFQKGDKKFFVAKASTAGEGITLHAAQTVCYVENDFDLASRQQSEDRAHRIGQLHPVNYIDLVARGSIDSYIIKSLREKVDISNQITGDRVREWLTAA